LGGGRDRSLGGCDERRGIAPVRARRTRCSPPTPTLRPGERGSASRIGRRRSPTWQSRAGRRDGVSIDAGLVASWLTRAPADVPRRCSQTGWREVARARRHRRADPAGTRSSRAPTTAASIRLTLRDARAPRHPAATPMPERPTPPAGVVAGRCSGLLCATTVGDSNRAIGAT
jgi:hypothetical protein